MYNVRLKYNELIGSYSTERQAILKACELEEIEKNKPHTTLENGLKISRYVVEGGESENETRAKIMVESIKRMAENESTLENFECYLSRHFESWFNKFILNCDSLVNEFYVFSNIK